MVERNSDKPVVTASPCVSKCCLNDWDVCMGCWRSLDEIKQWSSSDEAARQQTLFNAQQRRQLAVDLYSGA